MNTSNTIRTTILAAAMVTACSWAAAQEATLYEGHILPEGLIFEPIHTMAVDSKIDLVVKGPGDFQMRKRFAPGEPIEFNPAALAGESLADGTYGYELQIMGLSGISASREEGKAAITESLRGGSGVFSIRDGQIVTPETEPPSDKLVARVTSDAQGTQAKGGQTIQDQVIADDQIVQGSLCVGFDCVNGESFGFDTIRLKENNLRIKFEDTSSSGSFPSNDWQLTANDSNNGGANKFSVDDITGGRTPFTIEAGARTNSLYVESDGDVGFGTSNPVLDVHAVSGDSPGLRIEQDGSSGFQAQTWDLAGNETSFFIRDATNGSTLPFRVFPGSSSGSLVVRDSNVGIGTTSPNGAMHIRRTGNVIPLIESADNSAVQLRFKSDNTNRRFLAVDSADQVESQIEFGDGLIRFLGATGANNLMEVDATSLRVNGAIVSNGTTLSVPDYVFQDDYPLMTIKELKQFIGKNSHLPNVPSAQDIKEHGLNHTEFQLRLLEKVEELTLHTIQQQDVIERQFEAIAKLEERLDRLD